MKRYHYFSVSFILLMFSCNHVNKEIRELVKFPNTLTLNADSVSTQTIYDNVYLTTFNNYFVVSSFQADTMLHFYSTPDLKYLFGGAIKGHSSDEFESYPTFCESGGKHMYVRGHNPNVIRKYSICNNQLQNEKEYKILLKTVPNDMHLLFDSLLYYMDFSDHSIRVYNLGGMSELLSTPIRDDLCRDNKNIDIEMGCFAANSTTAMYAYQYKKEIEVYDTKTLLPRLCIKWDYKDQTLLVNTDRVDDIILHYTDNVATDNHFYLLYRGYTPRDKTFSSHIEVYDNYGNPIIHYHLNKKVFSLAVDEKNGYFYGFGNNSDYIYRFKYTLPYNKIDPNN